MEPRYIAKEEPGLHLSVLRLLNSPLRLICATIWRVVQDTDVLNYGILEEFLTLMAETVPDLLSQRQWAQLILGLRAKAILELCRCESLADTEALQRHLNKIRLTAEVRDPDVEASEANFLALVDILLNDPLERDIFFQEVFPVEYGPKYDLALQRLISIFVSRFEEFLPIPRTEKLAAMLGVAPSVMEECFQTLSHPQEFLNSLSHLKNHSDIETKGISPPQPSKEDDYIFSCLSHPPLVQVMMDTEHKACEVELESPEEVSVECEEVSASSATGVDTKDGKPEKEMREELVKTGNCQHGGVYRHSDHHQKQVCGDTKDDSSKEVVTPVEGPKEPLRSDGATSIDIKFIREDGVVVSVEDGLERLETIGLAERLLSAETQPEVQVSKSVHSSCQPVSDDLKKSVCHQRQLTVKLERIDITGKPLPAPLTRQSSRVRKIVPDDEPETSPKLQHLVTTPKTEKSGCKPSAMVFACSECSFHDGSEGSLHQHLMKNHPDDFSRLLSAGIHQRSVAELQENQEKAQQVQPPKRRVVSKKCPVCAKTFTRGTDMRKHLTRHLTKQLPFCSGCSKCFQDINDLMRHTVVCKVMNSSNEDCNSPPQSTLECSHCSKTYIHPQNLKKHAECLKCLKCTMCEETFNEITSFRLHYIQAHNIKGSYPCSHCKKTFTEVCPLVQHLRTHTRDRSYQCHECGKCFYTPGQLKWHERTHREERPYMCTHCGKGFKEPHGLKIHMQCHVDRQERLRYPCSYCGKTFIKSGALVRHNRIHTGERPHRCIECNKSFLTRDELLKHMRYHTGEKPFKCQVCNKGFTQSCYLTAHMRTHTGERPYACLVCEKRFSTGCQRKRHMLIHTGEKPHVCEHCGRAFNQKNLLTLHLKKHVHKDK